MSAWMTWGVLAAAAPVAAAQDPQVFANPVWPLYTTPLFVTSGDLNGDGLADTIVTTQSGAGGAVLAVLSNGIGGFGSSVSVTVGAFPRSAKLADFNNDGKLDLLTSESEGSQLFIALGAGNGTFGPLDVRTIVGGSPFLVESADVNSDGKADIATTAFQPSSGSVVVFLGNGVGGFGAASYYTTGPHTSSVAVGDINSDGRQDLVAGTAYIQDVHRFFGQSGGGFGSVQTQFLNANASTYLKLAEVNGDGHLDLVSAGFLVGASGNTPRFQAAFGNASGAFSGAFLLPSTAPYPIGFGLGDFNQDGRTDVARPGAVFTQLASSSAANVPSTLPAVSVAFGDLDGDADLDLICVSPSSIQVELSTGTGTFVPTAPPAVPALAGNESAVAGDFNRDGLPDLAAITAGPALTVAVGQPGGGFTPLPAIPLNLPSGARTLATGDLNQDGKLDYLITRDTTNFALALSGDGTGGASSQILVPATANIHSSAIGDVNGDGRPDFVAASEASGGIVSVSLNQGGGAFALPTTLIGTPHPSRVFVRDFSGDGRADLLLADRVQNSAAILIASSTGAFGFPAPVAMGMPQPQMILTNIGSDPWPDLVALDGQVSLALGSPGGAFIPPAISFAGAGMTRAAAGDFDSDGRTDLAVAASAGLLHIRGNGASGFIGSTIYGFATGSAQAILTQDFDLDGFQDLYLSAGGVASVILNRLPSAAGPASFGAGTFGCGGSVALRALDTPAVGSTTFGFAVTNAPKAQTCGIWVSNAQDISGFTIPGIALLLHVGIFTATEFYTLDTATRLEGDLHVPVTLPNVPALAGSVYYGQAVLLEDSKSGFGCNPAGFYLVSSAGITIPIVP
ncbi:MAG: VCBS repeat-containing protein [Planctomycetes bacterium]|nr:VCBS repeat-containing protein [Planctomycetota bacterium]